MKNNNNLRKYLPGMGLMLLLGITAFFFALLAANISTMNLLIDRATTVDAKIPVILYGLGMMTIAGAGLIYSLLPISVSLMRINHIRRKNENT